MTDTIKMVRIRVSAWDHDGNSHRVTVVVPSPFTEKQAREAVKKELGREVSRLAFN